MITLIRKNNLSNTKTAGTSIVCKLEPHGGYTGIWRVLDHAVETKTSKLRHHTYLALLAPKVIETRLLESNW